MSGPQPGTGCTVCEHEHATQINALINDGRLSNRQIARQFKLGKDTIGRHVFKRHPGVLPKDPTNPQNRHPEPDDGRTELERLDEIRVALENELRRAPRADISRELRQVNSRIAEIRGTDVVREVTVTDVQGLPEQVRRWFEALEAYPDAREAMFLATDKALLEAAGVESA